jgi:signal transduction histidine kinase
MPRSPRGPSLNEKLSLAEELYEVFSHAESFHQATQALVKLAHRMTRARSVAFFTAQGSRLTPTAHRSPSLNLGDRFDILDLGETSVHEEWSGEGILDPRGDEELRVFPGEVQSCAFRIGEHGVLYLGHQEPDGISKESLLLMPIMVAHAELGLNALASRQAELEALRSRAEALETLRTKEAQLAQSNKMAAVGVLAAGLAHELNTPLGAVKLGLDFVAANLHSKPERSERMLRTAQDGLGRAQVIANKLLHYCRKDMRRRDVFHVEPVVQKAVDSLKHQFKRDGVEVLVEVDSDLEIEAGEQEVQQVLGNLLLNARDAVLSGDYQRCVSLKGRRSEGQVVLEVSDVGPGVAEDIAGRIFDPFFTTKALGEGTGLGLSISHQIVSDYEGSLELLARGERGATFRLTFPCVEEKR